VIKSANIILFVADQHKATEFFRSVLLRKPTLDVNGMTEFEFGSQCVLGLMPRSGIERLLPITTGATPTGELYLTVDDPAEYHARALAAGATELSPLQKRDWGDEAAYSQTSDGHILAFSRRAS
jgi:uncharacterized protein